MKDSKESGVIKEVNEGLVKMRAGMSWEPEPMVPVDRLKDVAFTLSETGSHCRVLMAGMT